MGAKLANCRWRLSPLIVWGFAFEHRINRSCLGPSMQNFQVPSTSLGLGLALQGLGLSSRSSRSVLTEQRKPVVPAPGRTATTAYMLITRWASHFFLVPRPLICNRPSTRQTAIVGHVLHNLALSGYSFIPHCTEACIVWDPLIYFKSESVSTPSIMDRGYFC